MRTQKTIETVACDVCGEECKPVAEIAIPASFIENKHAVFKQFHFSAIAGEDICESCLQSMLRKGPVFFTVENG